MKSTVTALRCAPQGQEEEERMRAVRRYDILDTPPDGAFDQVTRLAARLLGTPVAFVSIVDSDRICFKSHYGLDLEQIPRAPGLCAAVIMQDGAYLVNNALLDPRAVDHPLVREFGLRFYLGIPLRTHDGFNLGALCVLDYQPRSVGQDQIAHLEDLARIVMHQLELRLTARQSIAALEVAAEQKEAALRQAELMTKEIDHRVLNSLNLIVSLLSVQSAQLRGTPAAAEIAKAAGKIMAVAQVHKHMRVGESVVTADCAEYLQRLCQGLGEMLQTAPTANIRVDAVPLSLPSDQIVRIGLIVNELVTNALKHGAGNVLVALTRPDSAVVCLSVTDDGSGLPAGFVPEEMSGLGMKVVTTLVRNLQGTLTFGPAPGAGGTRFEIRFAMQPGLAAARQDCAAR